MAQTQPDPFAGRVVIGVDGSEQSHDAVHWGAAYAALLGCEATLLHTWEMPVGSVRGLGYDTRVIEDAREGAQAILDEAARVLHEAQPDLVGHTALVPGGSVHALLGAATTARCLVVGSRGRGALASLLLGSTSDAVAARAECPVIVVPEGARWSDGGSVVLTSDGSPAAEAATRFAFDEAVRRQAHLEVLVTVEEPTAIATDALYFPRTWRRSSPSRTTCSTVRSPPSAPSTPTSTSRSRPSRVRSRRPSPGTRGRRRSSSPGRGAAARRSVCSPARRAGRWSPGPGAPWPSSRADSPGRATGCLRTDERPRCCGGRSPVSWVSGGR